MSLTLATDELSSFGFESGGDFSFQFSNTGPGLYFIGLATQSELSKNSGSKFSPGGICREHAFFSQLFFFFNLVNGGNSTWNGVVNKTCVLKPILINCLNMTLEFDLAMRFHNPTSFLDSRWIPSLKTKYATIVLFFLIIVYSIFNIVRYCSSASFFHYLVLFAAVFSFMTSSFSLAKLWHDSVSDEHTPFRELAITTHFLGRMLIFVSLLLGSSGWCIFFTSFSVIVVLKFAFISVILFSFLAISDNIDLGNWAFAFIFIIILFLVLLTKAIITNISDVELHIKGHLFVISGSGIDPSTTPVFGKLKKYSVFKHVIISYIFAVYLRAFVTIMTEAVPFWATDLFDEFIDAFVLFSLTYLFGMNEDSIAGFESIASQNVRFECINDIGADSEIIQNHSLKKWEHGMVLPPIPNIIDDTLEEELNPTNDVSVQL